VADDMQTILDYTNKTIEALTQVMAASSALRDQYNASYNGALALANFAKTQGDYAKDQADNVVTLMTQAAAIKSDVTQGTIAAANVRNMVSGLLDVDYIGRQGIEPVAGTSLSGAGTRMFAQPIPRSGMLNVSLFSQTGTSATVRFGRFVKTVGVVGSPIVTGDQLQPVGGPYSVTVLPGINYFALNVAVNANEHLGFYVGSTSSVVQTSGTPGDSGGYFNVGTDTTPAGSTFTAGTVTSNTRLEISFQIATTSTIKANLLATTAMLAALRTEFNNGGVVTLVPIGDTGGFASTVGSSYGSAASNFTGYCNGEPTPNRWTVLENMRVRIASGSTGAGNIWIMSPNGAGSYYRFANFPVNMGSAQNTITFPADTLVPPNSLLVYSPNPIQSSGTRVNSSTTYLGKFGITTFTATSNDIGEVVNPVLASSTSGVSMAATIRDVGVSDVGVMQPDTEASGNIDPSTVMTGVRLVTTTTQLAAGYSTTLPIAIPANAPRVLAMVNIERVVEYDANGVALASGTGLALYKLNAATAFIRVGWTAAQQTAGAAVYFGQNIFTPKVASLRRFIANLRLTASQWLEASKDQFGRALQGFVINADNTDFLPRLATENLFDWNRATQGFALVGSTNVMNANASQSISDYMPVQPNTIYAYGGLVGATSEYGADLTFLRGDVTGTGFFYTTGPSAVFARHNFFLNDNGANLAADSFFSPAPIAAVVTGFIDNGTGGGTPTGVAGNILTVTGTTSGALAVGQVIVWPGFSGGIVTITQLNVGGNPARVGISGNQVAPAGSVISAAVQPVAKPRRYSRYALPIGDAGKGAPAIIARPSRLEGMIWNAYGDSITEVGSGSYFFNYPTVMEIQHRLGLRMVNNYGKGGTTLANINENPRNDVLYRATTMGPVDGVGLVTFAGGTNDFGLDGGSGTQLGTSLTTAVEDTMIGTLNRRIPLLLTRFPNALIIGMTPFGRGDEHYVTGGDINPDTGGRGSSNDQRGTAKSVNGFGYSQEDYVNAMIERFRYWGIPYIDFFHERSWFAYNAASDAVWGSNGAHFGIYHQIVARRIEQKIADMGW
jgi:hypothetical protein